MSLAATLSLIESAVRDDRPAGYWGLDTANPLDDDSGNGNTLTAVGAPANVAGLLTGGDTGSSGARDFSGVGQAYTAADDPDLDLADAFTLEAWVKFDVVTGAATLFSKGTNGYQLRRNTTGLELHKEGVGIILATTGITLAVATLYHVVAAKHGSASAKIYVNGVDRSGAVTDRTCADTATALNIGRKSDATELLDGQLDEAAVYAYAFTLDMVTTHYLAGTAGAFGVQIMGTVGANVLPRLKVEVAFDSNPRDTYQRWRDVTSYVRELSFGRGRNFELDRMETGRLDVVLANRNREFDDTWTGSPFYPNVKPTRAVRVRATISTSPTFPRWFGYTEGHPLRRLHAGKDSVAVVTAAGAFKALALDKISVVTARPKELSGARLAAVLAINGVRSSVGAGQSQVVAADLDQANRLEHAQGVAETDGGVVFEAGDGTITFRDRHHRIKNEQTVRATYGDGGGTEIPIFLLEPMTDEARLFTAAVITPASGTPQEWELSAASDQYWKRTKELATLHASDNEALGQAQYFAEAYSTPRSRIPNIQVAPQTHSDKVTAWQTVLGHEISHRIESKERPIGDPSAVTREHFIEGISEKVTPSDWRVSFSVSPAELESTYWILGTGELGDTVGATNTRLHW